MTDLATVLARMLQTTFGNRPDRDSVADHARASEAILATPEGVALSALVEAAQACADAYAARWDAMARSEPYDMRIEADAMLELVRKTDAYREATK